MRKCSVCGEATWVHACIDGHCENPNRPIAAARGSGRGPEMSDRDIASAIRDVFASPNETDRNAEPANLVDGVFQLARSIASAARSLGLNDAATPMGAIEMHAFAIKETGERIAGAIEELARAVGRFHSDDLPYADESDDTEDGKA